ncbi:MAG: lipase [Leptolyngbyaceae bacterium]|nr:lipase [Leptolyngbyaceae bacterium]
MVHNTTMALPTVILPGYLAGATPYRPLEKTLNEMGLPTMVVPLRRWDWLPTVGGRSVTTIIQKLHETVQVMRHRHGDSQVNLVGHSAGGWIARIYLGDMPYGVHGSDRPTPPTWNAQRYVHTLVCLGTPHLSQERWTRRNLDFVNDHYPGAFYQHIRYICVAGKSVQGSRRWYGPSFAYQSYQLTYGQGDCWGDGITPIAAAHLDGADNLTIEQVNHSPRPGQLWYGSESILPYWVKYLLHTISS